ncbi:MAG: ABC transporter ATP-binding protein [Halanaerobiales bacterium]|nr:ABC transporter ATP-binding protein [Halanaerobiales bacterium]
MSIVIKTEGLTFSYSEQEHNILDNLSMEVKKGEILAILGLSGSGKSTLCYCLSGIIPHVYSGKLSGEVRIDGHSTQEMDMTMIATKLGIVFQNPETQLFFPMVESELAFGPENLCIDRDEIKKRIDLTLDLLNIKEKRNEKTGHLSGGQKQLIALASVLTLKPKILIFDEVMSQIDEKGKNAIKDIILQLKKEGKTVIMVSHNLDNIDIADRIMTLKNGRLKRFEESL